MSAVVKYISQVAPKHETSRPLLGVRRANKARAVCYTTCVWVVCAGPSEI